MCQIGTVEFQPPMCLCLLDDTEVLQSQGLVMDCACEINWKLRCHISIGFRTKFIKQKILLTES